MKVHLATAYPTRWSYLDRFRALAAADRTGRHALTDDPAAAGLILFVDARQEHGDWRFGALRRHPLVRRFPRKCFVYNETDQPWACLPGLYVSMPGRWFDPRRMAAWSYCGLMNPYLEQGESADAAGDGAGRPPLLFGFAGRRCRPVRDAVLGLRHPEAELTDTSDYNFFGSSGRTEAEMDTQRRRYAEGLRRCRFVLCPRGSGPASFRLFEALAAGRVPVILSDAWVPPAGPDWAACALRVDEADVAGLPALLEAADARWPAMAAAARATWDAWFASPVQFANMVDACAALPGRGVSVRAVGRRGQLELRALRGTIRRRRAARAAAGGG